LNFENKEDMKFYKGHIVGIFSVMFSSIILVFFLSWTGLKDLNKKNGFIRTISRNVVRISNVVKREEYILDFAGNTNASIFFKTKDPGVIVVRDYNLNLKKLIKINLPNNKAISSAFHTIIDSPKIEILACNAKLVVKSNFSESSSVIYNIPSKAFSRVAKISDDVYIFRGFDSTKPGEQSLTKRNTLSGDLKRENNILELRHDAGLSTDGFLHYDKKSNQLVYVYIYTNKIVSFDTNLNVVYKKNTIDTLNTFQTTAGLISDDSKGVYSNLTPKRIINYQSCIYNGNIYNLSKLKSDNESADDYLNNSIIDVYAVSNGNYLFSFYLPNYKNEHVLQFHFLNEKRIICLYKSYIAEYTF